MAESHVKCNLEVESANENTNGLIRQYIKKGAELIDVTDPCLDIIASKLNDGPRKTLGYKTPKEVFHE